MWSRLCWRGALEQLDYRTAATPHCVRKRHSPEPGTHKRNKWERERERQRRGHRGDCGDGAARGDQRIHLPAGGHCRAHVPPDQREHVSTGY